MTAVGELQQEKDKRHDASAKTTSVDMTVGNIPRLLLMFCIPLILGNFFQVLYNTVDTMVVGNFIGKEALAAVAATTPIVNIAVFFFNGISVGAGIVIGHYFGARNEKQMHGAIETTMALTLLLSLGFTVAGVAATSLILRLIATPEDVMEAAEIYLRIYFAGISGLLLYNMSSSVLRAVGDSKRPLYFLIISSFTNIVLDLLFVVSFGMGIAGAAIATIISQFLSAVLVLALLLSTHDVYRVTLSDLRINRRLLREILDVGLPAGLQSMITMFSNSFVIAYINSFGSTVMAGWGCYNKLDQIIMLPMQSMSHSTATFVSQNIGAGKLNRANEGTRVSVGMTVAFVFVCAMLLTVFAKPAVSIFTRDPEVIEAGARFIRYNSLMFCINSVNHTLAGSLRGRGNAKVPMYIMLFAFVGIRQVYLFVLTRFIHNAALVGFGYPVGWTACCIIMVIYYRMYCARTVKAEG